MLKRLFFALMIGVFLVGLPMAAAQSPTPDPALTAADYLTRGDEAVTRQRYQNAVQEYSFAIQLAPENGEGYTKRAAAYQLLEQFDLALADLQQVAALNPENAQAQIDVGNLQMELQDYDGAISAFEAAIAADDNPDIQVIAFTRQGEALHSLQKYQAAIRAYNSAIQIKPDYAAAYLHRAWAYSVLEENRQAFADINQAIRLSPEDANGYARRAIIYIYKDGDFMDQALADATRAVELDDQNVWSHYSLCMVRVYMEQDFNSALASCNEAIRLDGNFSRAYTLRGVLFASQERNQQAINDFLKVFEIDKHPVIQDYYFVSRIKNALGDHWQAIQYAEAGLTLETTSSEEADLLFEVGYGYTMLEGWSNAIDTYTRVLEIDPNYIFALTNRGVAYYRLGNMEAALVDLEQAIELNGDSQFALEWLGDIHYELVNYEEALNYYRHLSEVMEGRPPSQVSQRIRELERLGVGEELP